MLRAKNVMVASPGWTSLMLFSFLFWQGILPMEAVAEVADPVVSERQVRPLVLAVPLGLSKEADFEAFWIPRSRLTASGVREKASLEIIGGPVYGRIDAVQNGFLYRPSDSFWSLGSDSFTYRASSSSDSFQTTVYLMREALPVRHREGFERHQPDGYVSNIDLGGRVEEASAAALVGLEGLRVEQAEQAGQRTFIMVDWPLVDVSIPTERVHPEQNDDGQSGNVDVGVDRPQPGGGFSSPLTENLVPDQNEDGQSGNVDVGVDRPQPGGGFTSPLTKGPVPDQNDDGESGNIDVGVDRPQPGGGFTSPLTKGPVPDQNDDGYSGNVDVGVDRPLPGGGFSSNLTKFDPDQNEDGHAGNVDVGVDRPQPGGNLTGTVDQLVVGPALLELKGSEAVELRLQTFNEQNGDGLWLSAELWNVQDVPPRSLGSTSLLPLSFGSSRVQLSWWMAPSDKGPSRAQLQLGVDGQRVRFESNALPALISKLPRFDQLNLGVLADAPLNQSASWGFDDLVLADNLSGSGQALPILFASDFERRSSQLRITGSTQIVSDPGTQNQALDIPVEGLDQGLSSRWATPTDRCSARMNLDLSQLRLGESESLTLLELADSELDPFNEDPRSLRVDVVRKGSKAFLRLLAADGPKSRFVEQEVDIHRPMVIDVQYQAASNDAKNNGYARLWITSSEGSFPSEPVQVGLSGLFNTSKKVDSVHFGAFDAQALTSGKLTIDDLLVWRH